MAKVKLSENKGFQLLPEGKHIFKIVEVEYKEDFGKMSVKLQTKDGKTHTENYNFIKTNGETNDGALNVFSYMARKALNNFNVDEIDHEDLIGCYIQATVKHEDYENKDGETKKAVRVGEFESASGFSNSSTATKEEIADTDDEDDLDDFLND